VSASAASAKHHGKYAMKTSSDRLGDFLTGNIRHWQTRHQPTNGLVGQTSPFTIALSREAGTQGNAVAQEVASRLGWTVFDRELLEKIAQEMGVRTSLLETIDEKRIGWLEESIQEFMSVPRVATSAYSRHLIQTMLALGAHGECVIVGRGASFLLPQESTLRVRLVAPLDHRITAKSQQLGIPREKAAACIEQTDRDRLEFVRDLLQKDATDPRNYDLMLNTSIFSVADCAHLILEALSCRQTVAARKNGTKDALLLDT